MTTALRETLHEESVAGLAADQPVVMLNLMQFKLVSSDGNGSGWDAYRRYSAQVTPLLKTRGATIIWAGDVRGLALADAVAADADAHWNYAALVFYPTPAAFLDMLRSPEYARANIDREHGTVRHLILATHTAYAKLALPIADATTVSS